jgi:transposase
MYLERESDGKKNTFAGVKPLRNVRRYIKHEPSALRTTQADGLIHEKKALEQAIRQEEKKSYTCEADADQARRDWLEAHLTVYGIQAETVTEIRAAKRRRGRPRKDETPPPPVTVYVNRFTLLPPEESILEKRRKRAGSFVWVTHILDPQSYSDGERLKGYKEQYRVEQRFRFKEPVLSIPSTLKTGPGLWWGAKKRLSGERGSMAACSNIGKRPLFCHSSERKYDAFKEKRVKALGG